MKSVLIDEELHAELKKVSKLTGIKIKDIVSKGIREYLKKIKPKDEEHA
jgi:hypothetical protein